MVSNCTTPSGGICPTVRERSRTMVRRAQGRAPPRQTRRAIPSVEDSEGIWTGKMKNPMRWTLFVGLWHCACERSDVQSPQPQLGDTTKEEAMKPTPLRRFTVPLIGLLLAAHASAASLDDEAKHVVRDYFVRRQMLTVCGERFAVSLQEHQGLHRCDVCMSLQRGTMCRTAFSTDLPTATLTARDTACTFLAHSEAEEMVCRQIPPARVTCRQEKADEGAESKGFAITIHPEKVSQAEKRQNIQWKGTGSVETKERRTSAHETGSPWLSLPTTVQVTLMKEHDSWTVQPNDEVQMWLAHQEPIDCQRMEFGRK